MDSVNRSDSENSVKALEIIYNITFDQNVMNIKNLIDKGILEILK